MTAEERDELRRGLRAAGCEWLLNRLDAGRYCSQELEELRSLLRREERLRVMEAGVRAAEQLLDASEPSPCGMSRVYGKLDQAEEHMNADRQRFNAASELLETEVPDGQG